MSAIWALNGTLRQQTSNGEPLAGTNWLHLQVNASGAVEKATVNAKAVRPGPDGSLRLPPDFAGGTIVLKAL